MMRESSKTRARKPKVPSPQAATGGGGDNRASLAKRSVLRWVCCRVGPNEFWQARCLSAVCGLSTVVSFDEEKPPCRAVQGGAGKHRGESEAYIRYSRNNLSTHRGGTPLNMDVGLGGISWTGRSYGNVSVQERVYIFLYRSTMRLLGKTIQTNW